MHGGGVVLRNIKMRMDLVVEENMRPQSRQDPAFVNHMKESDLSYRSKCGRSNYCVGRMYTLEMKCHECVSDLPCSLKKEIEQAEADAAKSVAAAKAQAK